MGTRVNPGLLPEIEKYGAANIERVLQLRQLYGHLPFVNGRGKFSPQDDPLRPGRSGR